MVLKVAKVATPETVACVDPETAEEEGIVQAESENRDKVIVWPEIAFPKASERRRDDEAKLFPATTLAVVNPVCQVRLEACPAVIVAEEEQVSRDPVDALKYTSPTSEYETAENAAIPDDPVVKTPLATVPAKRFVHPE